jgi:hypothetical protein
MPSIRIAEPETSLKRKGAEVLNELIIGERDRPVSLGGGRANGHSVITRTFYNQYYSRESCQDF